MVKFNKHHVTDTATGQKARVYYSLDNHISGRKVVTLYAKTCLERLADVLPSATTNDSDYPTDYVQADIARLFEDHPLYKAARQRAEAIRS
jgi:hypothetical protein